MEKPTHDDDARLGKLAKTRGTKLWFEGWRHYKTKRGAQAYAKKHEGMWVIIDCSPKIMTKRELEWLGTWVVGRADHYLFYRTQMPDKFDEYYPAVEWWDNGVLFKTI
jgi:hypothetical protein